MFNGALFGTTAWKEPAHSLQYVSLDKYKMEFGEAHKVSIHVSVKRFK